MQQRSMSRIAFTMMRMIMALRRGRNGAIDAEMAAVDLHEGDTALDFGCGPGYNTISAALQAGPQGKVFAVDVTPQALAIVNKNAAAQQLTNITTRLSDCETGLDTASVNVAFLHNVLPMTERPRDILHEIARVLKPGGRLSYTSGRGSRMGSGNSITDAEVGAYLEKELGFTIRSRKGGHVVFTRQSSV